MLVAMVLEQVDKMVDMGVLVTPQEEADALLEVSVSLASASLQIQGSLDEAGSL